jgi:hypothetical protein
MNPYQRREAERNFLRERILERERPSSRKTQAVGCLRCNGRITVERFGSRGNYFFGIRCLLCGDVVDPVILLHRLTRDARIPIPDRIEEMIVLIEEHLGVVPEPA